MAADSLLGAPTPDRETPNEILPAGRQRCFAGGEDGGSAATTIDKRRYSAYDFAHVFDLSHRLEMVSLPCVSNRGFSGGWWIPTGIRAAFDRQDCQYRRCCRQVYPDRDEPNKYWYIPVSVEPWTRNNQFKSQLYVSPDKSKLTFIFRGQASVDDDTLTNVAKALGVPKANLSPVAYDSTQNLVCQNVFVGEKVQWVWPPKIGGYLEVVPISMRTTDPNMVDELQQLRADAKTISQIG